MLLDSHPGIYVAMYEKEVRAALFGRARSRNTYRENARLIATMRSIPGGERVAKELIAELRGLFPHRQALMEELDRVSRKQGEDAFRALFRNKNFFLQIKGVRG